MVLSRRCWTNRPIRDQLRENALLKKYYCDVNIGDLIKFNEDIAHRLVNEPADIIPLV
jgi:DNA replication licensing factor MCM5